MEILHVILCDFISFLEELDINNSNQLNIIDCSLIKSNIHQISPSARMVNILLKLFDGDFYRA